MLDDHGNKLSPKIMIMQGRRDIGASHKWGKYGKTLLRDEANLRISEAEVEYSTPNLILSHDDYSQLFGT